MIAGVADTHTALWYLLKNPRLSATARSFMDDAASAGHDIALADQPGRDCLSSISRRCCSLVNHIGFVLLRKSPHDDAETHQAHG